MAQASTQKPASEPWVPLLASPDAADRLAAIKIITYLPESSEEIVRLLEQTALHDADEAVCQAAENALLAYPNQPVYRSLVGRDETARQFMLYELTRLELAGLMGGRAARLSKARYSLAPLDNPNPIVKTEIPDPVAAANIPTEPAASKEPLLAKKSLPSLAQILLSETTIKISLYLGAFFVVAAAFILAALVEISRLPVLGVTTLLFVGVSLGLSRRLPLASFVLFCVALLMLPIDGQVLLPLLKLEGLPAVPFFWGGIWLITLLISGAGLFFYRSRLLSLAVFAAGLLSLYYLGQGIGIDFETQLLWYGLWSLAGLGLAYSLNQILGERFFWPIFISATICETFILGVSFANWAGLQFQFLVSIPNLDDPSLVGTPLPWVWIGLLWLSGSVYYLACDILTSRLNRTGWWYGVLSVVSLLPVPILFLNSFNNIPLSFSLMWIWSILLGAAQERTRRAMFKWARLYAFSLLTGFVFYSGLVPTGLAVHQYQIGATLSLAGSAIAAVILSRLKLRWYINFAAIVFSLAAYFSIFQIPQIVPLANSLMTGEIIMLPALFLLSLDWVGRWRGWSKQIWIPVLAVGIIYYLLDFIYIFSSAVFPSENVTRPELHLFILMCILGLFSGFYARSFKLHLNSIPWSFALLQGYLAVFLFMNIPEVGALHLFRLVVFSVPTLVLLGAEWMLRWRVKAASWRVPLLVMGIIAASYNLLMFFDFRTDQTWIVVLVLVAFALFWGLESRFVKSNWIWLPWSLSLSCAYAAYLLFWTIPVVSAVRLDVLWSRLPPALLLLGLEWLLRKRQSALLWRIAPLLLGSLAVMINIFPTLTSYSPEEIWMMTSVLAGYAVFFALDAVWLKNKLTCFPWIAALTSLYSAYLLFWQIPAVTYWKINNLITTIPPVLVFLGLEWLLRRRKNGKSWTWPVLGAGIITLFFSVVTLINAHQSESGFGLITCVIYAIFLGAYTFSGIWPQLIPWTIALFFACNAYWILFDQKWWVFSTWKDELKLLPLAIILLSLDLGLRNFKFKKDVWMPALALGISVMAVDVFLSASGGIQFHPGIEPAWVFTVWGLFFAFYTWLDGRPWVGYLSTSSFTMALVFILRFQIAREWVLALVCLAALFYLVGFILFRRTKTMSYGRVFIWSALILAGLISTTAPYEYQRSGVAGLALAAVLYTLEGLRRRSVWWGFPACILYFMSYSLALSLLNINEPQYFSIGAALLGIIMHYLLLKTSNAWAALVTGILAQLILFGTSYIQMVQSLDLKFFLMLFFQSLALLVYGLVVRSRTLVLLPIAFAMLGVVTVTMTILKGLPTALLIGCTGILLLILGIIGLLLRERLVKWLENFKLRLENW